MLKRLALIGPVALLAFFISPEPAAAQGICWWCDPGQGDGVCRRSSDDGYTECENVPGGGCDFTDGEDCPQTFAGLSTLTLDGGVELRGLAVDAGVFAVLTCIGETASVVYAPEALQTRKAAAREITFAPVDRE